MKRVVIIFMVAFICVFTCGCVGGTKMPFNGEVEFHSISFTVPERFIRDSTQSTEDFWVFENGNYSEYILISRKDIVGDTSSLLDDYVESMKEVNANSERTTFLDGDAVLSTYYLEDVLCQEILFSYDKSFYAVALRGGDESSFKEITDTIKLVKTSEKVEA